MRWSAAGRAGGRPATRGADRTRPGNLLRAAVAAPLLAVPLVALPPIALAPIAGAPVAGAAPAHADLALQQGAPTTLSAIPDDDASDPARPVRIDVARFEPRTVTPGAVVTITGTLTNTGASTITELSVRLQRGEVRTSRAELAAAVRDPDPAITVRPAFQRVSGELPPGEELDFSFSMDSAELRLERDGVYPVLLNVNGTVDGDDQRRVGELETFMVQQPVVPAGRTAVAWLWPLLERPHRSASGDFRDDGLADSIRAGGRLDRALAVLERLPGTVPPGGTEPVPALPVTVAVDPVLVEELGIMAAGPYPVDGMEGGGRGTEAASAFLERLRAVADVHDVVALSYADVDADALVAEGLSDVLVRSLPGGRAEGEPASDGGAADGGAAPGAGVGGTTAAGNGPGARIVGRALQVDVRTDLAWAAGGSMRADTLAVLRSSGVQEVVVGSGGLTSGRSAVGLAGSTASARTSLPTAAGPLGALVADATLTDVVGAAGEFAGGERLAEQRYLAELAVLTMQAPVGAEQTVLVAPPREVDADPEGAGAMMADTAELPWLRPASVAQLTAGAASAAGEPVDPVDAVRLDPLGLADVVTCVAGRDDLAGAVISDADAALAPLDAAISRSLSAAWRADPEAFRAVATDLRTELDRLRGRVTLLAPAEGTYSLASSDAPLILTVQNDLPFAVKVLLRIQTRGNRGLVVGDIGAQPLPPGERTTLEVPTQVRQSGGVAVTAALTTPGGGLLGERVEMRVRSAEYGAISLFITFGAAALLGLLFLRRLVRYVLRRRAATPDLPLPGSGGAGLSSPPTRSPV